RPQHHPPHTAVTALGATLLAQGGASRVAGDGRRDRRCCRRVHGRAQNLSAAGRLGQGGGGAREGDARGGCGGGGGGRSRRRGGGWLRPPRSCSSPKASSRRWPA